MKKNIYLRRDISPLLMNFRTVVGIPMVFLLLRSLAEEHEAMVC